MTMSLLVATPRWSAVLAASHYPAVGRVVPAVAAGTAAASQAVGDPSLAEALAGHPADAQVATADVRGGAGTGPRQFALVQARHGRTSAAALTDPHCLPRTFGDAHSGPHGAYAVVGNCLTPDAGPFAWGRLRSRCDDLAGGVDVAIDVVIDAMGHGLVAGGGDRRGPVSAALAIADPDGRRLVDVRIDAMMGASVVVGLLAATAVQQYAAVEVFEQQTRPLTLSEVRDVQWDDLSAMACLADHPDADGLAAALTEEGLSGDFRGYLAAVSRSEWWRSLSRQPNSAATGR